MSADNLVTIATYWVPDLSNIKGISGHLWCSILICAGGASYARSRKHMSCLWPHLIFCKLKITDILKTSEWGLEKSELPWEQNF